MLAICELARIHRGCCAMCLLRRLPPEQPSDYGAEELARRALAVIEGRGHR